MIRMICLILYIPNPKISIHHFFPKFPQAYLIGFFAEELLKVILKITIIF